MNQDDLKRLAFHRRVKEASKEYYWHARESGKVSPGFLVPPARTWQSPRHRELESIFEQVRKEKYPNRPSRIGARFVCPALEGFCSWSPVYKVLVEGKTFIADAEMYTMAIELLEKGAPKERIRSLADQYWKYDHKGHSQEVVVQGKVTVLYQVK